MTQMRKKPELLIPASSLDVLKTAAAFGADAVYIGGEAYGLRAKAKNFSPEDMAEGIRYAHERGVKVHVTVNIIAHNRDLPGVRAYLEELKGMRPDALIIADPGIFLLAGEICPEIPRHVSTQANSTNAETCRFWHMLGAARVVTARELSIRELKALRETVPAGLELETFVHGAMCISYSGRCLLSNYFTGRDANRGACAHPCRWSWRPVEAGTAGVPEESAEAAARREAGACMEPGLSGAENPSGDGVKACRDCPEEQLQEKLIYVEEETRPGEYLPVYENERGTYIFSSRDLCMIEHIPDLIDCGIDSFKIEGRMKNALYVATVARTYRQAIDDYMTDPGLYESRLPWYREQITDCTYRQFTTGFFYGRPGQNDQVYDSNTYVTNYIYIGTVLGTDERGAVVFTQKNRFFAGDRIEIMKPDGTNPEAEVLGIFDSEGHPMESAPHPQQELHVLLSLPAGPQDILRMRNPHTV